MATCKVTVRLKQYLCKQYLCKQYLCKFGDVILIISKNTWICKTYCPEVDKKAWFWAIFKCFECLGTLKQMFNELSNFRGSKTACKEKQRALDLTIC